MPREATTFGCVLMIALLTGAAGAQQPTPSVASDQEEEQMDTALRKFGYVSGHAFQCYTGEQQAKAERVALDIATNIMRLFGSDRAFYYAAAFGAGASEQMDKAGCPEAIKEAQSMIDRLTVLSTR